MTIATVLVVAAMLFSFWASSKVKRTYAKYEKTGNKRGITGAEAARIILDRNELRNVPIIQVPGTLSDYYDPQKNLVALGQSEHDSTSAVAVGVAAHECGHAIQYKEHYWPAKFRMAIIPLTNIGSKMAFPMILAGIFLSMLIPIAWNLIYVGIALFGLCVVFQLITLPTEFDASRRALKCIDECGMLDEEEYSQAREVLVAAALTYVAALAVALSQLLRLLAIYGRKK